MSTSGWLQTSGLTVQYGALTAVSNVDLAVERGELIAVTGPSGAGKTSLLSAIAGSIPRQGRVEVGGVEITDRDSAVAAHVVVIPQGNALVAVLTAAENVALPSLVRASSGQSADAAVDVRSRVDLVLAALGLDDAADQLADELSGGQQQRVAVARGLAQHADVLLADEPTSELDAGNRTVVMDLLRAEAGRGAAVLVATHDPEVAAGCDAELHLDTGVPAWVRDDRRRYASD